MIIIDKEFPKKEGYPVHKLTKGLAPVLFDIETTGLAADNSFLYLIGALIIKNDRLIFKQWFAESSKDETELINSFFSWLPDNACLIHFNGRGFDVPYLCKKCKKLSIPCFLPQMPNVDLYRSFAPLKDLFNMNSRRLVAYERLIGLDREDKFNGGELIEVYKEYIGRSRFDKEGAEKLKALLLLHNEEDILDMVPVLDLFSYMDLMVGNISEATWSICDIPAEADNNTTEDNEQLSFNIPDETSKISCTKQLVITVKSACSFPVVLNKTLAFAPELPHGLITTEGNTATIIVPIVHRKLKHFYEDYKNYYYLPEEDTAIHKNVADGVSKDFREQATKETAYTWAETDFIPQIGKGLEPVFSEGYKAPLGYIPVQLVNSPEKVGVYIKTLF